MPSESPVPEEMLGGIRQSAAMRGEAPAFFGTNSTSDASYGTDGLCPKPETGRRVSRSKSELQLIAHDVPEFRIVDQDLWDQVQARLREVRAASGADNPDRPRYWEHRRAQHMLTGKLFCGCCDGPMTNIANGSGRRRLRGGCVCEGIRRAASSRAPVLVLKPALAAAVRRAWVLWRFMYNLACWSVMCVPGTGGSLPGS